MDGLILVLDLFCDAIDYEYAKHGVKLAKEHLDIAVFSFNKGFAFAINGWHIVLYMFPDHLIPSNLPF